MQNKLIGNRELFFILLISFLFFSFKWILSFYYFGSEDITLRVISDSSMSVETYDSYTYFHYVKSLSDFDFTSLYNKNITSDYLISSPYGSIIIHSFLFKLFGNAGFIISEYIFITLFFFTFYLIFRTIKFSKEASLLFPTIFFVLPIIFKNLNYFGIIEIKTLIDVFYNLRFPRPLVVNIYFYLFIYVLLKSHINKNFFSINNLLLFSVLLGLTASSFFFFFLNMFLCLLLYLFVEYKNKIFFHIKKNIKKILFGILLFFIIITPFAILLINSNPDYMQRMGVFETDLNGKIYLINHYLEKLFRIKLMFIYFLLILSYYYMKKFNKENLKYIFVFYLLFFSSLLAPVIFIIFSNKIAFLGHFNNMVVLCVGFLIMMLVIINLRFLFKMSKISTYKNLSFLTILLFIIFYNINIYSKYFEVLDSEIRTDRDKIVKLIDAKSNLETSSILTFDRKLMTWSILKGNIDLFLVDGTFSQRLNSDIESDIIKAFKIMNLNKDHFKNFISNKKIRWRYNNPDLRVFFWQRYTANSSYTFNNSKDFDKQVLDFIEKSSPYYIHQFAIPNFEIKRLLDKFNAFNTSNIILPEHIIINEIHPIFKNINIKANYCLRYEGKNLNFYSLKKFCI